MNKFFVIGLIAAFMAVTLVPASLASTKFTEYATTLPGGYYWYAYGDVGFPASHKFFQIWSESNGHADANVCGVPEAFPPIKHVTPNPTGLSGLQVNNKCGWGLDTPMTP